MKKIGFILLSTRLLLTGCGSVLTPSSTVIQALRGADLVVTRTDDSAIHFSIINKSNRPMTIDWNASKLNDGPVILIQESDIPDYEVIKSVKDIPNTILKPNETLTGVLYKRDDFYFRDPVLYHPGGIRIKPLKYPATLDLNIDGVSNIQTIYMRNKGAVAN